MESRNIDISRLFLENYKQIYNYVLFRINGIKEDAEDISHEVFLKAAKYSYSYDSKFGTEKTWLFTIARNTLKDYYSKTVKNNTLDLSEIEEGLIKDSKQFEFIDKDILIYFPAIAN